MPRLISVILAVLAWNLLASPLLPQAVVGPNTPIYAPAIDQDGQIVAFGAAVNPDGSVENSPDLWVSYAGAVRRLTNYGTASGKSAVTSYTLSADGSLAAYVLSKSWGLTGEVHSVDVASGTDRLLTINNQGCVQPLVVCAGCFFPCVHDAHLAADGRVLYLAAAGPFNVVDSNGTVTSLPIYSGAVAAGPRRVISDTGLVVFSSSQPSSQSPPAATDIYAMNLDGSGLLNLTQFSTTTIYAQNAVISADGGTVAFESNDGIWDADSPQIFIVNADGFGLHQLTSGAPATNASLSADGSLVAFVQSGQIQIAPVDGSSLPVTLTNCRYSTAQDAMLDDNGTEAAFTIGPNGLDGAIYQAPASGGASVPIYAPTSLNSGASWTSPAMCNPRRAPSSACTD